MSFIGDLEGLVNPGGDPEAIYAAAAATRKLAAGLLGTATALDSTAAKLEKSWKGLGGNEGDSAAGAYQKAWGQFSKATVDFTKQLGPAADSVDAVGKMIQTAQAQARNLKWMLGISAAGGIALTIFTFGISDATAAAMAANEMAVAMEVMTVVEGFMADAALVLGEVINAVITVAAQFVLGVISDAGSIVIQMLKDGVNPWTMTSWTADDISNVLLGGITSGVLGAAYNGIPALSAFQDAHPLLSAGAWGAAGAFTWAVPWEFWIQGKSPLDLGTWGDILGSTATSAVAAPLLAKSGDLPGIAGKIMAPKGDSPIPGVTWSDVANNMYVMPITGLKLILFTGGKEPSAVTVPEVGNAPGGADVPVLPAPQVPVLPNLPAGSTAHVVQSGQTLFEIAGGNPALEQQIAALSNITDISKIYPGQVVIVPPRS